MYFTLKCMYNYNLQFPILKCVVWLVILRKLREFTVYDTFGIYNELKYFVYLVLIAIIAISLVLILYATLGFNFHLGVTMVSVCVFCLCMSIEYTLVPYVIKYQNEHLAYVSTDRKSEIAANIVIYRKRSSQINSHTRTSSIGDGTGTTGTTATATGIRIGTDHNKCNDRPGSHRHVHNNYKRPRFEIESRHNTSGSSSHSHSRSHSAIEIMDDITNMKNWSSVVSSELGYELFMNHLQSEFSIENLLYITEYMQIKDVLKNDSIFGPIVEKLMKDKISCSFHVDLPEIPDSMLMNRSGGNSTSSNGAGSVGGGAGGSGHGGGGATLLIPADEESPEVFNNYSNINPNRENFKFFHKKVNSTSLSKNGLGNHFGASNSNNNSNSNKNNNNTNGNNNKNNNTNNNNNNSNNKSNNKSYSLNYKKQGLRQASVSDIPPIVPISKIAKKLYNDNDIISAFKSLYNKYIDSQSAPFMINIASQNRDLLMISLDNKYYRKQAMMKMNKRGGGGSGRNIILTKKNSNTNINNSSSANINQEKEKEKEEEEVSVNDGFVKSITARLKLERFGSNSKDRRNNSLTNVLKQQNISFIEVDYKKQNESKEWLLERLLSEMDRAAREISALMNDSFSRFRKNQM